MDLFGPGGWVFETGTGLPSQSITIKASVENLLTRFLGLPLNASRRALGKRAVDYARVCEG